MAFSFLHTADWQIGKRFGSFPGTEKPAVLRDARLRAVDRLAEIAIAKGCSAVLVAGDIFDAETVPEALTGQLMARLRAYSPLSWHLLPGNHDPARAGGVWAAVTAAGLPANVHVHVEPRALDIAPGVVLLPAPLVAKRVSTDPTAWMDQAPSPPGTVRIGLAHGSVQGFGSAGEASVPIDPARVKTAGLAYLALGDWHGTMRISDRVWYSGTPEPDGFRDNDPGNALIVRIDGSAVPQVERVPTAHFTWLRRTQRLDAADGLAPVEAEVAALGSASQRCLMALELSGVVTLSELSQIEARLAKLTPQLFHLASDTAALDAVAAASDLEAFSAPALEEIAARLKVMGEGSDGNAAVARRALRRLFAFARQAEAVQS
ncbi:MAG TPA: DNA repair exonuclease [Hyphomicrobium sp.]|nr:DNA repair exonuclease [Hyphomicrobium sp.]